MSQMYDIVTYGLFACADEAEIRNVGLKNSFINLNDIASVGSICGFAKRCNIYNCYNESYIISKSDDTGGLVGAIIDGTIIGCYNSGYLLSEDFVGGIVCSCIRSEIKNCFNTGNIKSSVFIGGIIGDDLDSSILNCYNAGTISSSLRSASKSTALGNTKSSLYPYTKIGGISGWSQNSRFSNSYNVGGILGDTGKDIMGHIVGENNESTFNNCYYLRNSIENVTRSITYAGAVGKTSDEMKSEKFVLELNGINAPDGESAFISDKTNENNGYPILRSFHAEHIFGEYKVNSDGTNEIAECTFYNCGVTNTRPHIHTWGEYVYNNDADCMHDGTMTASCTIESCTGSDTITDPLHPKTAHIFGEWVCGDENYHSHTCSECGTTESEEHSYSQWKSNGDAKFFKYGNESRYCEDCGHIQIQKDTHSATVIIIFDMIIAFIKNLFIK